MVYSTKPAMSKLDHFVHVVTCRAENFKVATNLFVRAVKATAN